MLFCPASNPKHLFTAMIHKPDCILFDLEDSVAYKDKLGARDLLSEALQVIDYKECEVFVRINALETEFGTNDVNTLVKSGLKNIRLPMCEKKEDVEALAGLLDKIENENGIAKGTVSIQCAIETPLGVENALEIARASSRVVSISFGAEDFTRSLGISRSTTGKELAYARGRIVVCAQIAGVDAIDTVYSDIGNSEGFIKDVENAKEMGFAGKSCIHPSQVILAHHVFSPSEIEIDESRSIIEAAQKADIHRGGVILLDGKMVDIPVIEKAKRILTLAGTKY